NTLVLNEAGITRLGNPTAPVEVVVIEDLLCKNCRKFSLEILPQIQSEFVRKGKDRLTLVSVAFLTGSKMIADAAMQVYEAHPDKFIAFLKERIKYSEEGGLNPAEGMRIEMRIGWIDLDKLRASMEKGSFNKLLVQNHEWAKA